MRCEAPPRPRGLHPRDWVLSISILAMVLLLTTPFRSASLDDFDSYSFALALDTFDLTLQQPHPPGFPVYIAAARVVRAVVRDPTAALTLVSALCGGCSAMLIALLGRQLDPARPATATIAALLVALSPVGWLTSLKALSDTPGLSLTLASLWLWAVWYRREAGDHRRPPLVAALTTGLALGVRPQNALPLAILITTLVVDDIRSQRSLGPWLHAGVWGLLGVLSWLVPTARHVGGLPTYMRSILAHAQHVGRADALAGTSGPVLEALRIRALSFGDTLLTALAGTGLRPPLTPRAFVWNAGLATLVFAGLAFVDWRQHATKWLGIWTLSVSVQIFLFETLDRPRLLLPLLPPLALLVAMGWARIVGRGISVPALIGALTVALLGRVLPWAYTLSQVPAPPSQTTAYIAGRYPATSTLVAAAGSFRAAQAELPGFRLAYLYDFNAAAVKAELSAGLDYVAVIDRDQFPAEAMETLSLEGSLVVLNDLAFSRDRRIHTQHDEVRLQILTRPDLVPREARLLPTNGCIDLGTSDDGRYVGEGWYRAENIAGTSGRWAGGTLTSTLHFVAPFAGITGLRFRSLAYPPDQGVTLGVEGRDLIAYGARIGAAVTLPHAWTEIEVVVPPGVAEDGTAHKDLLRGRLVSLVLQHRAVASPFEVTGGMSSDRRRLATAYDWLCVLSPAFDADQD